MRSESPPVCLGRTSSRPNRESTAPSRGQISPTSPYSARFAAGRMGWPNGHMRADRAIRRLVEVGVVARVGELAARGGQPRGTATYAPPSGRDHTEPDPVPVETTEAKPPLEVVRQSAAQSTGATRHRLATAGPSTA